MGEGKGAATGAFIRQIRDTILIALSVQFYIDREATTERVIFAALRWQYALYFPEIAAVVRKIVSEGLRGEKDALPEVTGLVVGRDISVSSWGGV